MFVSGMCAHARLHTHTWTHGHMGYVMETLSTSFGPFFPVPRIQEEKYLRDRPMEDSASVGLECQTVKP